MNDLADDFDFEDPDALAKAREKLRAKGFSSDPKARKQKEKKIRAAVDGRSLRGTGRTEQFNFKCREEIKRRAVEAARADGITIAEWMERAIEAAVKAKGA
jgi:predicted HicB family RNase H-like nuclease